MKAMRQVLMRGIAEGEFRETAAVGFPADSGGSGTTGYGVEIAFR